MNIEFQNRIIKYLPGKTNPRNAEEWLPAWIHMMDTAGIMKKLVLKWLPESTKKVILNTIDEEEVIKCCMFVAMIHDIGKFTPLFCSKILPMLPDIRHILEANSIYIPDYETFKNKSQSPHALAGAAILLQCGCPMGLVSIVGAHHGKTITRDDALDLEYQFDYSKNYCGTESDVLNSEWWGIYSEWFLFALSYAGYNSINDIPKLNLPAQMVLTGLLIVADWLSSNNYYYPLISVEDFGDSLDFQVRNTKAWKKINLPPVWSPASTYMDEYDFQFRFGFSPNEVQKLFVEKTERTGKPGIYILEAQMGVGKTEAALAAAEILTAKLKCGGLFFGLPTQATANGLFPRLYSWAETQSEEDRLSIRLAHGMAALNEQYRALFVGESNTDDEESSNLVVHPWFEGRKQALLANFVIGTVDQFLMTALKQKHVMIRHLGMTGKVIIIDECHAYDAYMSQYLDRALQWAGRYGIPVIILSATLPPSRRSELIEAYLNGKCGNEVSKWRNNKGYPLLTWTDDNSIFQETIEVTAPKRNITIDTLSDDEITGYLEDKLSEGGCAGVIVNTVNRAQKLYRMIEEKMPDKKVILFHSRFIATDRSIKEKQLLSLLGKNATAADRDNLIVIGTQVLEQSLDIDFDILLSDLCPMDLLLQRIGRLQRHEIRNGSRPAKIAGATCVVLGADRDEFEDGSKAVYGEWLLSRTKFFLPEKICLPDSIPELVHAVYEKPTNDQLSGENNLFWKDYVLSQGKKKNKANAFRLDKPSVKGNINGLTDADINITDPTADAAVRDGENSLSVICLVEYTADSVGLVPWLNNGKAFSYSHVPYEEDCIEIAKQKLNLPSQITRNINAVLSEMEERTQHYFKEWQQSAWLNGELILVLDANLETHLSGYLLSYDERLGLLVEKEE